MNVILLSGGSGKRLWPLSNNIRSKQFIKLFKNENGSYESMLQRVFKQIRKIDSKSKITVATSKSQVSAIVSQLGTNVGVSVEPSRKDTFPAIALASLYLYEKMDVDLDEPVVVCPVDTYVDFSFFNVLESLSERVTVGESNLVLCGIEPTYPSEKFGYIIPKDKDDVSSVLMFKEKPNKSNATKYIKKGALWNGGVFAFKLGYVIDRAHELLNFKDYEGLYNKYNKLDKISFDYAVCEHEKKIEVIRYNGSWRDLGTWNSLTEVMEDNVIGAGLLADKCDNVHLINELDTPILAAGLKDVVIAASPDGILVSDKELSQYIKDDVEKISEDVMYAEKSWGRYRVVDKDVNSQTIKITLYKNHSMGYHSHKYRDEQWVVISGSGIATIDEEETELNVGDSIRMLSGQKHKIFAQTEMKLIEIQTGKKICVEDKIKY